MSRYAIIDLETTSLDTESAEIIEIAIILYDSGPAKILKTFHTLIRPEELPSKKVQVLTGISSKEILSAPRFDEVADEIELLLSGETLVAHKVSYDYEVLKKHFFKINRVFKANSLCTLELAKRHIPGLESYKLSDLLSLLKLPTGEAHRALSDARMTLDLFKELIIFVEVHKNALRPAHQSLIEQTPNATALIQTPRGEITTPNARNTLKEMINYYRYPESFFYSPRDFKIELKNNYLWQKIKKRKYYPAKYLITYRENKLGYLQLERSFYSSTIESTKILFAYKNRLRRDELYFKLQKELSSLLPKKTSDKTFDQSDKEGFIKLEIAKHNSQFTKWLRNYHPLTSTKLFISSDLTVKLEQDRYSVINEKVEIKRKQDLPLKKKHKLTPWQWTQYLEGWRELKNSPHHGEVIQTF